MPEGATGEELARLPFADMTVRSGALTVLVAVLLTAGCSGGGSDTAGQTSPPAATTTAAEPKTEAAARAFAEEVSGRFSSGDWGGFWDVLSSADQRLVTRDDFLRYHEECPGAQGVARTVEAVRLDGDGAVVRVGAAGFKFSYRLAYEDGRWRWELDKDARRDYRKGVDALISERKKDGSCQ